MDVDLQTGLRRGFGPHSGSRQGPVLNTLPMTDYSPDVFLDLYLTGRKAAVGSNRDIE